VNIKHPAVLHSKPPGFLSEAIEMASTSIDSNNIQPYNDYTEGASAIEIDTAVANNRRSRRDSQYSIPYGAQGEGSMFDGPGHTVNPSSISRMSYGERTLSGRRSSERRESRDSLGSERRSQVSRKSSTESQVLQSDGETTEGESHGSDQGNEESMSRSSMSRPRRKSLSPLPHASVFENLVHLFRRPSAGHMSGRRSSTSSRRSDAGSDHALRTDGDGQERWGYSSGEEDNDNDSLIANDTSSTSEMGVEYDSYPPTPGPSLPLLSLDPIFGEEVRIDVDGVMGSMDPPSCGPASRQSIYIPDEDSTVRFIGYETITWRIWLWNLGCFCTVGLLGLLGHWFPRLWLRWATHEIPFKHIKHGFIVVEVGLICDVSSYLV
jgi:cation-transporting ATPase 13A2